jgi:hypothetical protein
MSEIDLSKYQKWILTGLFLVFLVLGALSHNDYGIAWDEPSQQEIGKMNYDFLIGKSDSLANYHDRFYGAAFEMPVYMLQQAFGIENSAAIYDFRHLITNLIFIIGVGFFFALIYKLFQDFNSALLGSIMLYIHPRIFAHAFFNSKDIVFMSFFIIGLFTLFLLLEKQNTKRILLHALVSAILIDIRIIGIILPLISLLAVIPSLFKFNSDSRQTIKTISTYSILLIVFLYLFWPALWTDPLLLGKAFARMSHFPFRYDVLFQGQLIAATDIPWTYLPIWIGISTPPFILLLFIIGFGWMLRNYIRDPEAAFNSKKQWYILVLASFPFDFIILLIIISSTLYDGWRQVFFLYPLLLISAVYAYNIIMKKLNYRKIGKAFVNGFIIVFILLTILKIYKLHPYEQVYFNHFVSKKNENRRQSFEMDYWGLSYREALEYIIKNDNSPQIKVCFANAAGPQNILYLSVDNQQRIIAVDKIKDANYFISNYRYHPDDYPYQNEIYSISRDKNKLLSIFKIKE